MAGRAQAFIRRDKRWQEAANHPLMWMAIVRTFQALTVIEIHTRKALAIEVGPHLRGEHVVDVLNRLAWRRKAPAINNPDFNPIKNAFAKLKAIIRARAARTIPPWNAVSSLSSSSRPSNAPTTSRPPNMNRIEPEVL
ncbi:hypothetical protein K0P03_20155 [Shinella sp. HY16]|jgi:hypothetical protein|nr:hypothetical protein [Shinella sp. HY16]MDC7271252.1 hypothetical protein [Shinella sp. YZ44]